MSIFESLILIFHIGYGTLEDEVPMDRRSELDNQIQIGMLFDTRDQVVKVIRFWSISQNKEFIVVKS